MHDDRVGLRPATATDEDFVRSLHESACVADLVRGGLDATLAASLARVQGVARWQQHAAAYPAAEDHVVELEGRPVGRLLVDRGASVWHVVDVGVLAAHRGRGTGTAVLTHLCADADRAGSPVTLAVVPGNPAVHLYRRLGFDVEDEQPDLCRMRRRTPEVSHA